MPRLTLPAAVDDHDGLIAFVQDILRVSERQRWLYEWSQYQNCLFYLGIHWIVFDQVAGTFIPVPTRPKAPKPVTNKFASVLRPLVAMLSAEEPNLYFAPMTDQPEDVATAQVGSRALDILYRETGLREMRPVMARWDVLTGNAFMISGFDTSQSTGKTVVQNWRCQACGKDAPPLDIQQAGDACPFCGSDALEPSLSPNGKPRVTTYARGRVYTDVAPVFEMHFDWQAGILSNSPWVVRRRSVSESYLLDLYGKKAEDLPKTKMDQASSRYFLESLAYASVTGEGIPTYRGGDEADDRVEYVQLWLTHPKFPMGLYAEIGGGKVLHADKMPYQALDSTPDNPRPLRTIAHLGYEAVPGRVWYKTPSDDLVPKQRTRNRIEASIELHMRRAANTVWTAPEGSHITKVSGEQGILIRYSTLAGGQPPQRLPGAEISQSHWQYIERIDKEMEDLAGTYDALRGEAPPRVTAYSAIQLLEQRAQQGLSEAIVNWSLGHQNWAIQALAVFKGYAMDDRFAAALGENGQWAMSKFTSNDLRGAVRVEVEAGLGRPRTLLAKRAVIEQAVRLGVVNVLDPSERYNVLRILGIPEMSKDLDLDMQAAAIENDTFLTMGRKVAQLPDPLTAMQLPWPRVRTAIDNHTVHLSSHRRFAMSENFRALTQIVQEIFFLHTDAHMYALQATYGQVQGQGAPMPKAMLTGPGPTGDGMGGEMRALNAGGQQGMREDRIGFAEAPAGGGKAESTGSERKR